MNKTYDIVVLGGGTGGYLAAIRGAQLGKTVAVVERDKLGGTCLHRGCIPSKAMLRSAEVHATVLNGEAYGVVASSVQLDFNKVQERKNRVVEQLHTGVQYLMKKHKIEVFHGNGRIIGPSIFAPKSGAVAVERADGEVETLLSTNLIIATGSRPRELQGLRADGTHVLNSDQALQLEELPESIIIIGGGVIGVEWASMLNDFGVKVTVLEAADRLIPQEDKEVSRELERTLSKRGVRVITKAGVMTETFAAGEEAVSIAVQRQGEKLVLEAAKILVSVGRQGNVEGIGLENTDIKVDKGVIKVNARLQTAESHIYAIGDVIGGLQLAHVAGHEGITAVEHICGGSPQPYSPHLVPRCVYTRPETASVGWTEDEARERGVRLKVGKFPFQAVGKALVYGDADGFVKVIADADSNDILGVHMIGSHVTDLISEAALAALLDATAWEVGQTIHPHPTLSEAIGEAMLAVDGRAMGI